MRNKNGQTALHYCFAYGYFELGEYLVSKGASPDVRNANGRTPYEEVEAAGNSDTLKQVQERRRKGRQSNPGLRTDDDSDLELTAR